MLGPGSNLDKTAISPRPGFGIPVNLYSSAGPHGLDPKPFATTSYPEEKGDTEPKLRPTPIDL